MFPRDKKYSLLFRSIGGHLNFFLMSIGVSMLPMSLAIVCFMSSPFWVSIIARIWLKEKIILLEIIGMIICFSMVGAIAIDAKLQEDE